MNLEELKVLAGVKSTSFTPYEGSNISITGTEKSNLMKKNHIQPGTQEWFRLWFSKPYLTGETPVGFRGRQR